MARRVESSVIVPVDPGKGGDLQIVERLPRPVAFDQLGLVQSDHRFGERIVVRVTDRPDGRLSAGLHQTLGVADGGVLRAMPLT